MYTHTSLFANAAFFTNCGFVLSVTVYHILEKKIFKSRYVRYIYVVLQIVVSQTEIRLIVFFAVKDGETLYSQQKQD